jgi:hypothetical protein
MYLREQLSVSPQELADALKWLKFKPGQREDIWFTPLYWIEDHYVLFSPMCAYANFERFVESIFARMSESDSGAAFERYVVRRVRHAVEKSRLDKITVSGPIVLRSKNVAEEIDILVISGTALFVGEVKYDCFAADEINVYQHIEKMRRACEQAARKADFIRRNWATIAPILNIGSEPVTVHPFALTEKPFLSGFFAEGVPILALRDFEDFFEGEIMFNVTVGRDRLPSGGEIVTTFRSVATIPEDLQTYMVMAPRTAKFVERLRLQKFFRPTRDFIGREYQKYQFDVC